MGKFTDDKSAESEFYEAIPFSGDHYIYRDDAPPFYEPLQDSRSDRTFAIITLLLMAVVAAAVGLLLAWGVSTLQATESTSSLTQSK